jgi:hypothetical protein
LKFPRCAEARNAGTISKSYSTDFQIGKQGKKERMHSYP